MEYQKRPLEVFRRLSITPIRLERFLKFKIKSLSKDLINYFDFQFFQVIPEFHLLIKHISDSS